MSRVKINWLRDYQTEIEVRGLHHLKGDEAPEYGGEDTGPMPTDYLLVAVGTCMCLAVAHVAKKRRLTLGQLKVGVSARKHEKEFRFDSIDLLIQADLPPDQLQPLIEQARRVCFVSNTITAACPINMVAETIEP
ncbi:MAG: OsmC family protein [Anaerolineae bacterium]|nr:OsmC family protein [Anaerolineae bacterium]